VESTADFQQATVQGQLTYRVADPKKVASLLDFSIGSRAQYLADGPLKLQERLVKEAQVAARAVTQRMTLPEVLISATAIGAEVSEALKTSESITSLGVEIMSLAVISIKPTPEMAKALEAGAREALQRKSDEAIYARRNAAVEQERRIKESELNTELAVEEKKRQIREAQMAAEIAIEEQRALLMDQKVANERKDADRLCTRSCVTSSDHSSSYSKQSEHRRANFRVDRDPGTIAKVSGMATSLVSRRPTVRARFDKKV
jgi:hypothetical protein